MVKQAQILNPRSWSRRTLALLGLPVVVAMLFSVALVQSWVTATQDIHFVAAEQRGVAYLQPLTDLLDRMVEAQSTTVGNNTADASRLREGMRAVDAADRTYGDALGSGQRWADLRNRIDGLINQRPTGEVAYRSYTEVIQLLQELIKKIADTSKLVLDPVLDSYYLMDTAVMRLSDVVLFSGRAADLALLASLGAQTGTPNPDADTRIAVARYQVALDSDGIAAGLRKAMDVTASSTLGPNITNQLDTFRSAVDGFVPPLTLQSLGSTDANALVNGATEVRTAARKLTTAVLTELDRLLQARADSASISRMRSVGLALLALVLTGLLLWLMLSVIARLDEDRSASSGDDAAAGTHGRAYTAADGGTDLKENRVTEELVHVGRAIRARRRERADDAR